MSIANLRIGTCTFLSATGPSSPPQNVTAETISSTEVLVSWSEVPEIDRNGIITQYQVLLGSTEDTERINFTSLGEIVMNYLDENVLYSVTVSALTAEGRGPFSFPSVQVMPSPRSKHRINDKFELYFQTTHPLL